MIKAFVLRFIPVLILNSYHFFLVHVAAIAYGHPSKRLIVVGVTGTNGKSSTVQFIGRILEHAGERVGWTTTVGFKIADREWVNDKKMTMLGRFQTQRLLAQMVDAGCRYAIIETSSQGISQFRHVGIAYDVGVFTNLTPEHLEAHGGFDAYKSAKGKLFAAIAESKSKVIDGKRIERASVVNELSAHANFFLSFHAGREVLFGSNAQDVQMTKEGTRFQINGVWFEFKPIGRFNFENVLAAITTCLTLGLSLSVIAKAVLTLEPIPGRLELIKEGQPFSVVVDYGPEPFALRATYDALGFIEHDRLIHVLGSTGGGRDVCRRAILGEMAGKEADLVIVTNEDPYDDDPMGIINDVAEGAVKTGKQNEINLFKRLDRKEAIDLAIHLAQPGDLVLITGKGSEPVMAVANGKKIPWNDAAAVRKALKNASF